MRILIISSSWHNSHSFIYSFSRALTKLENEVIALDPFIKAKESPLYFEDLFYRKYKLPLSSLIEDYGDLDGVLVENTKFALKDDLHEEKPVVAYYHRDYNAPPQIYSPDVFLYRYETDLVNLHRNFPDFLYDPKIKRRRLFWHAINPNHFKTKEKKILKGLVWPGLPNSIDFYVNYDSMHEQYYFQMKELLWKMKCNGIIDHYFQTSETLDVYKRTLAQSEFALIIMPFNAFESRRLYEAAYLGAIPVIYYQNEKARKTYEQMGFLHFQNCIMFMDPLEIPRLDYLGKDVKTMLRERAQELVANCHTYEARAKEFLEIIQHPFEKEKYDYPEFQKNKDLQELYDKKFFPYLACTNENIERAKRGFEYAKSSADCVMYDRLLRHYNEVMNNS